MACCLLAAFILGHWYLLRHRLVRWLGLSEKDTERVAATDWMPGHVARPVPKNRLSQAIAAGVIALAAAILLALYFHHLRHEQAMSGKVIDSVICRSVPATVVRDALNPVRPYGPVAGVSQQPSNSKGKT